MTIVKTGKGDAPVLDYAAETGGADAGLRSEAMTSGLSLAWSVGVNFDSCFG